MSEGRTQEGLRKHDTPETAEPGRISILALCEGVVQVPPDMTVREVKRIIGEDEPISAVVVVQEDRPIKGYDKVEEGDYVVLVISDRGVGIPAEDIPRIFEPFYTRKVMGRSGTGLGMAVVWGAVKDHGGYIDVESRLGEGTTFTLYFPASRETSPGGAERISVEDCMGKGESILVVDDVEGQREIATGVLRRLGYRVHAVSSGKAAVPFLRSLKVDILVLDMIMDPGMDGLETYEKILAIHPGQKAVIASGFSESQRVRRAQELGAGAYIKKPYTFEK
ncbi:MAG: response regulator, partial [Deltaproteobacteria bacterium]|nr:response regulator [Deltaproteobacteria bacterium]